MKKIFAILMLCFTLFGCVAFAQSETDAMTIPDIESAFENTRAVYKEYMGYEDKDIAEKIGFLKKLNYSAYAYCTDRYFVQTVVSENGVEERLIKTFVQDKNVRIDEYLGGELAYVQIFNVEEDIYYEYDAKRDDLKRITNATEKGWNIAKYDYGFFPWNSCNALQGERSESEFDGRKVEVYSYDMCENTINSVWFDAERGIPLQFTQGEWTEVYTIVPVSGFDAAVFKFDTNAPGVSLSLDDVQSVQSTDDSTVQSQDTAPASTTQLSLETLTEIPAFTSTDMDGNELTNAVFADYKVTLLNLWGTWCSPCVAEMPTLQKLYDKYNEDGLNIIGVTDDANGNEELVREIVETQGVKYTILYPDEKFYDDFVSLCFTFPSSVLVDSEGKVLTTITGDPGFEKFDSILSDALRR